MFQDFYSDQFSKTISQQPTTAQSTDQSVQKGSPVKTCLPPPCDAPPSKKERRRLRRELASTMLASKKAILQGPIWASRMSAIRVLLTGFK
uniref:BHLH domain-containing protein n=1 Tax=Panagrellus redivivus TaxID=6233 RepID=A0A7E4UXL2_PANRE